MLINTRACIQVHSDVGPVGRFKSSSETAYGYRLLMVTQTQGMTTSRAVMEAYLVSMAEVLQCGHLLL